MPNNEVEGTVAKCPNCETYMRPITMRDITTTKGTEVYVLWECPVCRSGLVEIRKHY